MYKIVTAVNSMIENANLISSVGRSKTDERIFFLYDEKFKWSITQNGSEVYYLRYYPGDQELEELKATDLRYFKEYVLYSTEQIKTKEAVESFAELYSTVQSKLFNIDDVLDQIIKTAA